MYTTYFGLAEKPFSLTPDPRFLYLSERHAEALAHLQFGILEGGGFIQLTGEIGTGKTTLTRTLLARLPEEIELALVLNPRLDVRELLLTIAEEFGIAAGSAAPDNKTLIDRLNAHLLETHARGGRAVLVIDEAQNLAIDVLEQLRLLTNLETDRAKLLQIILIGQPELRSTLARNDLRQLAQRISGRYHLGPLDVEETAAYVRHRLRVAGAQREIFTPGALRAVHRLSGGVPRLINVLCDRALLGAYTSETHTVTPRLVSGAATEVGGASPRRAWPQRAVAALAVGALSIALGAGLWRMTQEDGEERASDPIAVGAVGNAVAAPATARLTLATRIGNPSRSTARAEDAPPVALDELLRSSTAATGTSAAFATLFELWRLPPPAATEQPCRAAARQSLRCEHQLGSWTLLASLDRPAILALVDSQGAAHQVVASALDATHVTLRIGARAHRYTTEEVAPAWFGEFLFLWRPAPGADELMLPGMRGAGVRWLHETLLTLQGGPDGSRDPAFYDTALTERVRAFQRARGLEVDGKAGLQTLIALTTAVDRGGTPSLRRGG